MLGAEVRVKCLNDFGFDKRNVLAGLSPRIEIAIAFDPGASENANVRDFNERTTGSDATKIRSMVTAALLCRLTNQANRRIAARAKPRMRDVRVERRG